MAENKRSTGIRLLMAGSNKIEKKRVESEAAKKKAEAAEAKAKAAEAKAKAAWERAEEDARAIVGDMGDEIEERARVMVARDKEIKSKKSQQKKRKSRKRSTSRKSHTSL